MAITPLDLQTMFVRMNEVGKEQNHLKDAVASQQAAGAKLIKENELRQDKSVNKAEEGKDGQKIGDESENSDESGGSSKEKEDKNAQTPKKVFQDPELGSLIDISG